MRRTACQREAEARRIQSPPPPPPAFPHELPTGVIVGTAVIERVSPMADPMDRMFRWHLAGVERSKRFRKPKGHPQPVWFTPF